MRMNGRIMILKIVLDESIVTVMSTYHPKPDLDVKL